MEWRPIDSAPRDGTRFLIYESDGTYSVAWWDDKYIWVRPGAWISEYQRSDTLVRCPTHWMPLPPPPAAGQEG